MRKIQKPYSLVMGNQLKGYFLNLQAALEAGSNINLNRVRSSGGEEKALPRTVFYEQVGESQRKVHEDN